jgi:hypothetical protein
VLTEIQDKTEDEIFTMQGSKHQHFPVLVSTVVAIKKKKAQNREQHHTYYTRALSS